MSASVSPPADLSDHQARAIASLSEELHLPVSEVRRTYLEELRRLHSLARIRSFISILAFNSTRSLLREKLRSRA